MPDAPRDDDAHGEDSDEAPRGPGPGHVATDTERPPATRRAVDRSTRDRAPVVEPISPVSRAARGTGKPTLNRPLEITHLP